MKNTLPRRPLVLLAALLVAGSLAAAEDFGDPNGGAPKLKKSDRQLSSSSVKASEKPLPRVWVALTGSYTPLKQFRVKDLTNSNTGEEIFATGANGLVGGGVTVNLRVFHSYWISLGSIYRFTGYDATDNVNDLNGTLDVERTRARYLDFPVMVRYNGRRWNVSKYTFYELGGVMRDAVSVKTTTNSVDAVTGELGPGPTSGATFKRMIYGVIAGAGVAGKDDFGIVVSPEVRYTRWMGDTFASPILGTQRNQLEVTVSFGF